MMIANPRALMLFDDILLIVSSRGFEPFGKIVQSNGGAISRVRLSD
jgi:hypothetical protein